MFELGFFMGVWATITPVLLYLTYRRYGPPSIPPTWIWAADDDRLVTIKYKSLEWRGRLESYQTAGETPLHIYRTDGGGEMSFEDRQRVKAAMAAATLNP